jgi:hypothetical protein
VSQPELGTNTVSLRASNRPLSGSMAFLGHLGLNTVQKSKGEAKNPLNGARQWARAYIASLSVLVPKAGFCFCAGCESLSILSCPHHAVQHDARQEHPLAAVAAGVAAPPGRSPIIWTTWPSRR